MTMIKLVKADNSQIKQRHALEMQQLWRSIYHKSAERLESSLKRIFENRSRASKPVRKLA